MSYTFQQGVKAPCITITNGLFKMRKNTFIIYCPCLSQPNWDSDRALVHDHISNDLATSLIILGLQSLESSIKVIS